MRTHLILPDQGRVLVELDDQPYEAILETIRLCESAGLFPARVDAEDWMTLAGIGLRIGTSRELVRLWSIGAYGPRGFPPPLNPECDSKYYSWTEVSRWIQRHRLRDVADVPDPVFTAMNLALQLRRLAPEITRMDAVMACIAK